MVLGLLVGWILMLDYSFIPMVICLFTAKAFEVLLPGVSFRVWVAAVAARATAINLVGIKVADRVNLTIMAAQLTAMLGLVLACIACLRSASTGLGAVDEPVARSVTTLPAVMCAQAGSSRLLYVMGRAGTLPTAFLSVNTCVLRDHVGRRRLGGGVFKVLVAAAGGATSAWLIASFGRTR